MEKILLRVTGVRAEMRRSEVMELFGGDAAAWKIKFPQRASNPNVHRKRRIKTAGKQQKAIGDFVTNTMQFHQFLARLGQWQTAQLFQIEFSIGDPPCGGEQMRRAKTHFARTKFGFGGNGKSLCGWK